MEQVWLSRQAFAEAAEALGVDTTQVMALHWQQREEDVRGIVIYTPGPNEVVEAILERDSDGILRVSHTAPAGTTEELREMVLQVVDLQTDPRG
jgi:hypothetical protein